MPSPNTPANTGVKVATTNNAAKDDLFGPVGWLTEDGGLTGTLAVLANDPGSAKIVGWSDSLPTTNAQLTNQGALMGGKLVLSINPATGQLNVDASGLNGDIQHLGAGDTQEFSFYYTAQMGNKGAYSSARVVFTVTGVNDAASISGDNEGAVVEDGTATDSGTLTVSDVDDGEAGFQGADAEDLDGEYGDFTFDPDSGEWTFTIDNDAAQSLGEGITATETLTVTSLDGTATETITVTVTGVNDAASISGDNAGDVTEDGTLADSGTLTVSDVDGGEAVFQEVAAADLDGDYGDFTFDLDTGEWSYTLDNGAAQGLGEGETATDTLTVTSLDGTASETITVTVTGVNDAAEIGGDDSGAVTEDDDDNDVSGQLTISDADGDDEEAFDPDSITGAYGTLVLAADGSWTYTLDNDTPALDDLDEGESDTDSFTITSVDGTEHVITITINGADEEAAYVSPTVFTGDGDPNDFDSEGDNNSGSSSAGNDQIRGTAGDDVINAGTGNDTIYTGDGDDTITAGPNSGSPPPNDNDTVYGGSGNDTIHGGRGNDTLYGGSGNDVINGNDGQDTIIGGYGADTLDGGAGNNNYVYLSALDTGDTITGFDGGDKIDLSAFAPSAFVGALAAPGLVGPNQVGTFVVAGNTVVYVDTDGIAGADLEITLVGLVPLAAGDFIL